jgi:hypothetical protein
MSSCLTTSTSFARRQHTNIPLSKNGSNTGRLSFQRNGRVLANNPFGSRISGTPNYAKDSYSEKWYYVRNNPVRASLVEHADNWPFQGELEILFWHD